MSDSRRRLGPASRNETGRAGRLATWLPVGFVCAWLLSSWVAAADPPLSPDPSQEGRTRVTPVGSSGCLRCHAGIEDMHPEAELSCVDCHGGDATAREKLKAHVLPQRTDTGDERVAGLEDDLQWRRFRNPMDLRVAHKTCGECHADMVDHLETSLHGTTAGHLSDGYYEVGLLDERGSPYGIFPVFPFQAEAAEIESLRQVPGFKSNLPADQLSTHYTDLARKECMQCHLWSEGRAIRGRVGFDGDYRGHGCAACHVPYAINGLSESADRKLDRNEPGHPLRHSMTRSPTTQTCTSCHYGDASIGLHFRGLSQLPPGAPGGPDIPGTTKAPLNRTFYLNDASITPPDVHHDKGMHCIDCHTLGDVMGDGLLHGAMEHAVEISCSSCHGTFSEPSSLRTERGAPLEHLFRKGEDVYLKSKVTGTEHQVPQVVHVLDPDRPEYNPRGAEAMRTEHANIECYTCHAGWNVNFLGFHFDRNETLTQLDLLSGRKTPGRVTTQEKVFATWKSFYAGLNESGAVAPYLTGFSTMGSVTNKAGERILDQVMPETSAGLSGLTMVHHQLHSTRPTARSCVECHRSSSTWGMGSSNFRLARQMAFVADRRGIEVIALNRANLASSLPLAKLVLPDVIDLEVHVDPLQGHAQYLYAAEGGRGIHVIDVSDPTNPTRVNFVESVNPRGMHLAGNYLFSADGIGGLRIYDVTSPARIELVSRLSMFDAHEVYVQWPYAYVADGPAGLTIVDVRAPIAPRIVSGVDLNPNPDVPSAAIDVSVMFQYSRPLANKEGEPVDRRSQARSLCAAIDENVGLVLIDVTEPGHPKKLFPREERRTTASRNINFRGGVLRSHVDLASPRGATRTYERDYAYLLAERSLGNGQAVSSLVVVDVSNPRSPQNVGQVGAGQSTEMLTGAAFYNQPFLQPVMFTAGQQGIRVMDVSVSAEPAELGTLQAVINAYVIAVEEFPLDKMIDEDGRRLKDVSHVGSRWLYRSEIERILNVPGERLGTVDPDDEPAEVPGMTARLHFRRLDKDRSGLLEGSEFRMGGGVTADINGDGRISLRELGRAAGVLGLKGTQVPVGAAASPFLDTRVDADGDLARLLDGVNPYEFDRDSDYRLSWSEMESAFFRALDLNADDRLTRAELSRHPGELRQLRYRDAWAAKCFEELDLTGDNKLGPREFHMKKRDWEALDANADGFVQLLVDVDPYLVERGFVGPNSEWPSRRLFYSGLPPVISVEQLRATFDRDGDGRLTQRELKRRADLLSEFDGDGDSSLDPEELARAVAIVLAGGVEFCPDGFSARWDLDRDGKVRRVELPVGWELPLRGGLSRD